MGYTHYWRQSRAFTEQEWAAITAEARRIMDEAGKTITLRDADGTGKPSWDADGIYFNGDAAMQHDHESFVLDRAPVNPAHRKHEKRTFNFCKTARKPYDPVVVSVLCAAQRIAPEAIAVSSDGGNEAIQLLF